MSVTAAEGFRAAGVRAGLKASGRPDLALVVNDGPLDVAAGVFTANRIVSAPVIWSRGVIAGERGGSGSARAVVLNSGSANACTGPRGAADAAATAERVAGLLADCGVSVGDVLVCSTGVIGVPIDMPALEEGVASAVRILSASRRAGHDAATAIMTTDTVPKEDAITVTTTAGDSWTVGGMIKGVGMLAPGLATMLCVITTDAVVEADAAARALSAAAARTVGRINSDGCMSTNDTVLLLASGSSGLAPAPGDFDAAVAEILSRLGRRLVADAEGATHDIAITVTGAITEAAAGGDPNWGRVLSQLGTVSEDACPFDPDEVDVTINGVTLFRHGELGEDRALVDMSPRETRIDIDLSAGGARATVWTNDLTHGYVTINADYTT